MIRWPCVCSEVDVPHDFLREVRRSDDKVAIITKDNEGEQVLYEIQCAECANCTAIEKGDWDQTAKDEDIQAQRTRRANLTRYPRFEPHSGEIVKSKEHELETIKRLGFHVAEHGIDDAYSDETASKLRSDRLAREERKRTIRKKRETLIREGVIKPPKKRA